MSCCRTSTQLSIILTLLLTLFIFFNLIVGVFKAAEKDGVYPEVLFKVAHLWYDMFCDYDSSTSRQCTSNPPATSVSVSQGSLPSNPPSSNNVRIQKSQVIKEHMSS